MHNVSSTVSFCSLAASFTCKRGKMRLENWRAYFNGTKIIWWSITLTHSYTHTQTTTFSLATYMWSDIGIACRIYDTDSVYDSTMYLLVSKSFKKVIFFAHFKFMSFKLIMYTHGKFLAGSRVCLNLGENIQKFINKLYCILFISFMALLGMELHLHFYFFIDVWL